MNKWCQHLLDFSQCTATDTWWRSFTATYGQRLNQGRVRCPWSPRVPCRRGTESFKENVSSPCHALTRFPGQFQSITVQHSLLNSCTKKRRTFQLWEDHEPSDPMCKIKSTFMPVPILLMFGSDFTLLQFVENISMQILHSVFTLSCVCIFIYLFFMLYIYIYIISDLFCDLFFKGLPLLED